MWICAKVGVIYVFILICASESVVLALSFSQEEKLLPETRGKFCEKIVKEESSRRRDKKEKKEMVVRKMKEKCKDAARMRREKERSEFVELSKLLPLPSSTTSQLDKASIIRLTSSYLRMRSAFPQGLGRNWGKKQFNETYSAPSKHQTQVGASIEPHQVRELGSLLLQTLDGFVFALHKDGKIMYISETASVHLGLPQIDLTGSSVFEFIHPSDHNDIYEILALHDSDRAHLNSLCQTSQGKQYELPRSFCMRMKCILPKRNAGLVSGGYKAIHCNGYLKVKCKKESESNQDGDLSNWESCALVAVGHSLLPSASTEVKLTNNSFMFRANLDLKLYYIEAAVIKLLGFQQMEMIGQSLYQFVHSGDLSSLDSAHRSLLEKGQVITRYYRLMKRDGGFVWVQSYISLVNNPRNMPKPQHVVSINLVLANNTIDQSGILHCNQLNSTTSDAVLALMNTGEVSGDHLSNQLNNTLPDKDRKFFPLSQRQFTGQQQKILRNKDRLFNNVKKARKMKSFDSNSHTSALLQPQINVQATEDQSGFQCVYLSTDNSILAAGHCHDNKSTIGSTRRLSDDSCSVVSSVASTNATSNISSFSLNQSKDFSSYTSLDIYTASNENLISPQPSTFINHFSCSPNRRDSNQVNESSNYQASGLHSYAQTYQYQPASDNLVCLGLRNERQLWSEINSNEQPEESTVTNTPSIPHNQLNLIPQCNQTSSNSSYFQSTSDWLAQSNYSNQSVLIDNQRSYSIVPFNYQYSDDRLFTEHNDICLHYNEAQPYLNNQSAIHQQVPIKSGYEMSTI